MDDEHHDEVVEDASPAGLLARVDHLLATTLRKMALRRFNAGGKKQKEHCELVKQGSLCGHFAICTLESSSQSATSIPPPEVIGSAQELTEEQKQEIIGRLQDQYVYV